MKRVFLPLLLAVLPFEVVAQPLQQPDAMMATHPTAASSGKWCATPSPSSTEASRLAEQFRAASPLPQTTATWRIPVAFHVLTDGKKGLVSAEAIQIFIDNLNWAFRDTPFSFYLYRADLTKNKSWFNNCVFKTANQEKLRKRLALDTRYYLNVYTCKLGKPGVLGMATFPFPGYPTGYRQGIALDPSVLGTQDYQYGLALAHETGHYLGLYHTFENAGNPALANCADPGDFVDDTPTQAFDTFGQCPIGIDTCPALPELDDIPNFMNYSTDECWEHFTPGQTARMIWAVQTFRPGLGTK